MVVPPGRYTLKATVTLRPDEDLDDAIERWHAEGLLEPGVTFHEGTTITVAPREPTSSP